MAKQHLEQNEQSPPAFAEVVQTPVSEIAGMKAQIEQLNQILLTLLTNKTERQEYQKTQDDLLREKAEQANKNLAYLRAKIEQELVDGPRKFLVSIPGEPMMLRKVGAPDEANAEIKFRKYHGILAIVDPLKGIVVKSFAKADEESLPTPVKDALSYELPKTAI